MQTGHMCQPTSCLWPPSLVKDISCSFLHEFEWFLLHWMHHLKLHKTFWRPKIIEWCQKILSFRMQIGHMCQPTSCTWPLHFEKAYLAHSFIDLNDFYCIKCDKWRDTKCFWTPKTTEQCTKIYKSFSLRY